MARKPGSTKSKKSATPKAAKRAAKHGGKTVTKADQAKAQAAANPPPVIKLPPKGTIKTLVGTLAAMQAEAASYTGDIGKTIATAKETKSVDTIALSITRRLDKMARGKTKNAMQKFQTTFYHLMAYIEECGFQKIADAQGVLDMQQAAAAEGGEDGDGDDAEEGTTDDAPAGTDGVASPALKLVDTEQAA